MRDMYLDTAAHGGAGPQALQCTFRMINAETKLMYSSDYPHWDFDLPSVIYDLPFLSERPSTTFSAAPRRACSNCRRATRSNART